MGETEPKKSHLRDRSELICKNWLMIFDVIKNQKNFCKIKKIYNETILADIRPLCEERAVEN